MGNPIICTITMPSGNTYDIVDQGARDLIKELLNFTEYLGVTTSSIDDGSTTNPITIGGESVTAVAGDVVTRSSDNKEFIYSSTGIWQNFGSLSGLGALAFKDSASASYTPSGSVSSSFTGSSTESTGKFTPSGSVSSSFSGSSTESTGKFTPSGSVSSSFSGSSTTSTGTYTPAGSISGITGGTKTIKQFKTAGSMPSFTVSNGNLTITDGSVPTGEDVTVGDGSISSQGSFTGTEATISVSGTPSGSVSSSFTGTEDDVTVTGTPSGSVSSSFTGTEDDVTVTGTPSGSVSASFTGTAATITVS